MWFDELAPSRVRSLAEIARNEGIGKRYAEHGIKKIPYIGALLRLAHEEARSRVLRDLAERGLGDIN